MFRLIYLSRHAADMNDSMLDEILSSARTHNASDNLTGLLISVRGLFLQYLEGEEKKVLSTFARIGKDTRHADCAVLLKGAIYDLSFYDWKMGVKKEADLAAGNLTSEFLATANPRDWIISDPKRALELIMAFKRA